MLHLASLFSIFVLVNARIPGVCTGGSWETAHGGLPMYVTLGLYGMRPPTIAVPTCIKEDVEKLFELHRKMDQSELKHNLIDLDRLWDVESDNDGQQEGCVLRVYVNVAFSKKTVWKEWQHLKDESANMLKTVEDLEVSRRSREFLWQEGHTAFATKEEADTEFAAEGLSARPCFSCS
ncbi:hypothetical protein GOBAR_DD03954 [Gossypium barbadense]|nr:hypothetical protein GOBAR_DD03954 [Gossypium barbadense]